MVLSKYYLTFWMIKNSYLFSEKVATLPQIRNIKNSQNQQT